MKPAEVLIGIALVALALFVYAYTEGWFEPPPTVASLHAEFPSWSVEDCERVLAREIWIGMTSAMARKSRGSPATIDRTVTAYGTQEQWVYERSVTYSHTLETRHTLLFLYFVDGILIGWQD